ncbi:MAG: hypothetical protein RLZZ608_155 [Actinomycetota bacterium]|jgi:hypothetical protein
MGGFPTTGRPPIVGFGAALGDLTERLHSGVA